MIQEKDFFCQFTSYSNVQLAKSMCGTTSIALVLSAEGKLENFLKESLTLDKLLILILKSHKNDKDSVIRKFFLNDNDVYVTVGMAGKVEQEEGDFVTNDQVYVPVFTLSKGYDHRASENIFKTFGINAGLYESYQTDTLFNDLLNAQIKYFLASVVSKYSVSVNNMPKSHIVVVEKAFQNPDGIKRLQIVDPAQSSYKDSVQEISVEDFDQVYNGFGTYVR